MVRARRTRIISVAEEFDEMIKKIQIEAEKRRGRKPSVNELTAELSKKNLDKVMEKILFG